MENNYFNELNAIDVSSKIEKKNGLSYLSWAYAWAELKKRYPESFYTVYENANGLNYHTDGNTCWVKTGVTVNGLEHIEYLPVMDFKNKSIPVKQVTSFDVNKAIQRSLTKAVARHGLGLYVYAGEDLPEGEEAPVKKVEWSAIKTQQVVQGAGFQKPLKDEDVIRLNMASTPEELNQAIDMIKGDLGEEFKFYREDAVKHWKRRQKEIAKELGHDNP